MNRNNCEAVLHLHRTFLPRRRTGRGFLTGTVFLDAALLITAFVLVTSQAVLKPGISLDLPSASQVSGIHFNDTVLSISHTGMFFFNDQPIQPDALDNVLKSAAEMRSGTSLILQADRSTPQSTITELYDAAARAGFRRIFIATQHTETASP